jgi:REP element-mobilizing transposase RayT
MLANSDLTRVQNLILQFSMASTYLSLHYHVVFSTKDREPLIRGGVIDKFHEYLGGTIRGLDAFPQIVGGVADHVHLLFSLKATHRLSDFMRELKKATTVWMKQQGGVGNFSWQDGYAAFTVSATAREQVVLYIANQAEHHRQKSFREELLGMLQRAGMDYDERYLD